ncbi:MAG: DUF1287 domain-containing protein [Bacillota bacterium]
MPSVYRRIHFILITLITAAIFLTGVTVLRSHVLDRQGLCVLSPEILLKPGLEIPLTVAEHDENRNGVSDALDFVAGARREAERRTRYDASYRSGGYPPEGRGACTDVIWRAFREAGYDLKKMVDEDIREAPEAYGTTGSRPDPNIDFRRVSNLVVFFQRHGRKLTTEVKPGNIKNLTNWQPGDIVVFGPPWEHIGIISDQRRADGVPLLIHNAGPRASEGDYLLRWPSKITHHFRYPAD